MSWGDNKEQFKEKFIKKIILPPKPEVPEVEQPAPIVPVQPKPEEPQWVKDLQGKIERKEVGMGYKRLMDNGVETKKGKGKTSKKTKVASKNASPVRKVKKALKKVDGKIEQPAENKSTMPKGKKALMAKKMEHMREIANINKSLGISKKKK